MFMRCTCIKLNIMNIQRWSLHFFWRLLILIVFVELIGFSSISITFATPFDRYLMPGKLIGGHRKIENKCDLCHAFFDKKSQNKMCLACHKKINKDVVQKKGYHGKEKLVTKKVCKYCHTDHVGRKANIVDFDQLSFNHNNTDFTLSGKHRKTSCISCHKKNKKYRNAVSTCIGCHKKNDIHKSRLGKKCRDCHKSNDWRKAEFDHSKTKYPLEGAHKKVSCGDCHPNQRFKATPTSCAACHKVQDVHRGEFGDKCKKCHIVKKWKNIRFDHDKDTKFKLRHRHQKISCKSCHIKNAYKVELKKDCFSCHSVDDKHNGNYGNKCNDCHTDEAWGKVKFKHDRDTKFKLIGVHSKIACSSCHLGRIAKEKKRKHCKSCHGQDDIHNGKLKKDCDYCHDQFSWSKRISFDHDLTNFHCWGCMD